MEEFAQFDQPAPPKTNTLGVVGFVLAFCISPIGLILSLIALTKPPRGFAIAGTIIGLLGSIAWAFFIVSAVLFGALAVDIFTISSDREQISRAIITYRANNNDAFPPDLASLGLSQDVITDPQGNDYGYTFDQDAGTWSLLFVGFDGVPDSGDEVELTDDMSTQEVSNALAETIKDQAQSGRGNP